MGKLFELQFRFWGYHSVNKKVIGMFKILTNIPKSKLLVTGASLAALAISVIGSYNIYSTDYLDNFGCRRCRRPEYYNN